MRSSGLLVRLPKSLHLKNSVTVDVFFSNYQVRREFSFEVLSDTVCEKGPMLIISIGLDLCKLS